MKLKFFIILTTLLLISVASCSGTADEISTEEYILTTGFDEGDLIFLGVSGAINGQPNPVLSGEPGQTITVTLINGGYGDHTFSVPDLNIKSGKISEKGDRISVSLTLPEEPGEFAYYDSMHNHAALGMHGTILVGELAQVAEESSSSQTAESPQVTGPINPITEIQKGGCSACHMIPGVPGAVGILGPDLSNIGEMIVERMQSGNYDGTAEDIETYLQEAILAPDEFLAPDCNGTPCTPGVMPSGLAGIYSQEQLTAIVDYLAGLPESAENVSADAGAGQPVVGEGPALTPEEFDWAKQTFFERCAGCHGTLRNGATGPSLTPDQTQPKGTLALSSIIFNGTPRGMPDWGLQGFFTEAQTEIMAKFLQNEPPDPPEMSLEQMKNSWQVFVDPADRPGAPQHDRNWENFFVVTLRDAGQVAVIDGDTYEVVNNIDTGYAVHISRMSATGRYVYTIGRDGKLALIDLWMEVPDKVAEVQVCYDARSVETSKYNGELGDFTDMYAIVGCYWPPHFVVMDGQTLEPFKVVSTRSYTYDTEEFHPEPRVAAIVASHHKPEWIVNVKETGQVWLVDYADPLNPQIKMIEAELFLHDGGWDATKRYFMVAANQSNKIAVIDALEGELEALVDTPALPHPGRGANWIDPEYGPVWSTSHLGDPVLTSIGTDPENNPDSAWQAVRTTELPGAGSLFIKTHPNSEWIWVDMVLNPDEVLQRTICVIAKANPSETHKCWEISDYGRAVHMEYNMDGSEIWVSVWGFADKPGQTGEIVIYDDKTLEEIARIPDLVTPTGKFNVYNTVHDIY
ncbi:MAG: cytochrome D1 domain-containing protein [Anaerolineales bacterium]|jgi:nitrite reductase (NO-forming)/hydroxylamine reductase